MERQDKLDLVIKAIEEAKGITPKGQEVTVYLSNVLKYKQFRLQELYDILHKLEDDEKILTLMRFPRYLLKLDLDSYDYTNMLTGEKVNTSKEYFTIKAHRSFNKWSANYWKLKHQQAGSVKWTKKEVLKYAQELRSPFEKLEKPNSKMPKKSTYQKVWQWIDTHRILSILGALAALATIFGVMYSLIR